MNIAVQIEKVTKYYHSTPLAQPVLKALDLRIKEGKFTILMGASGSGKSTLLYLLSGLDYVTSGSIQINGIDICGYSESQLAKFRRQHIGFVFQNHNLIEQLTLEENIFLAGYLQKKDKRAVRQRAKQLLNQLDIGHLARRLPGEVSGGESQRCAIARALINEPELLMADEPTGNLNSESSWRVLKCFQQLHKVGKSILMATHDVSSAAIGDEIYYLKDGTILDCLDLENIRSTDLKKEMILGWLENNGW